MSTNSEVDRIIRLLLPDWNGMELESMLLLGCNENFETLTELLPPQQLRDLTIKLQRIVYTLHDVLKRTANAALKVHIDNEVLKKKVETSINEDLVRTTQLRKKLDELEKQSR